MAAAAFAENLVCMRSGEELAFIGLPSKRAAKQLTPNAGEIVQSIATILGQMLTAAIERRTAAEFTAFFNEVFPNYSRVMLALSKLTMAIVPHDVLMRVNAESLCEMEADFRNDALSAFGSVIQDQAVFTAWTLRKIADIAQRIGPNEHLDSESKARDVEMCSMFAYHGLRTRFHLDCLSTSMKSGIPIYPEVLQVVSDGLRSAVDAYGWIKQGLDLRLGSQEPVIEPIALDQEDNEFLAASAYHMASDPQ
jgi:hypothetical protein